MKGGEKYMATRKQTETAKKNIKKAQKKWQDMSPREHSLAQPKDEKEQSLEQKVKVITSELL